MKHATISASHVVELDLEVLLSAPEQSAEGAQREPRAGPDLEPAHAHATAELERPCRRRNDDERAGTDAQHERPRLPLRPVAHASPPMATVLLLEAGVNRQSRTQLCPHCHRDYGEPSAGVGEQAQVDWAHFGKLAVGRALRPLWAFVMVLSYSRRLSLRIFPGAAMPFFVRGHVEAFADFGGVPRVLLYDNLKSAVVERHGDALRFHSMLLDLSAHYRFEPRPVAVARGNEEGRVERAIRYVREAFFEARSYAGLDDLNRQATEWTASAYGLSLM
ncbi:hypothetical protein WMF31_19945 [Sorangium sp. So ce1036]